MFRIGLKREVALLAIASCDGSAPLETLAVFTRVTVGKTEWECVYNGLHERRRERSFSHDGKRDK